MPLVPVAKALITEMPATDTGTPDVDLEVHEVTAERTHAVDLSPPPLSIHPGIPDDTAEEAVLGGEDSAGLHQGIPPLPPSQAPQALPQASLSPEMIEFLSVAMPDLQTIVAWWQERQRQVHHAGDPDRQLERQTYHVQRRFIELIKREADRHETTYAAIVNRAFAQYFAARFT